MALPFESEQSRVLLTCSCSALSQIARLYFCRHCIQLRCPLCVSHEVDSYYCPNCLENMPSAEAKVKKNRCANCFDCPSCGNTLSTRATAVAIQADKTDDSKATQAKKVYYLACGFCRWSSRDVGIEDKSVASGAWQEQENPAAKRVSTLVEYYRQLAQKEKAEREKKKMTKRRNYMHLSDKFGFSSLTRRKSSLSYLTASLSPKGKEIVDEEVTLKNPSEAVEEVEILAEEFYNKPLILEKVPLLSQRLCQPDFQPQTIGDLHPRHKHLLAKRSQRCRQCEHNLSKPEFNPSSIKFKIQLGAVHYLPMLRISNVPVLKFGKEVQVTLSFTNPIENLLKVTLLKLEDEKEAAVSSDGQDKNSQETDGGNEGEEKSAKSTENKADEGKGKDVEEVKITEEEQKTAGEKKKEGVVDAPKKPDRTVNNSCQSRLFVPTAKVILPTFPLMLGARDEAAEFDEMDSSTPAEIFNDDPRVVVNRQANKLWFLVKVVPQITLGDVKFSIVMQYDYKHTATALVRGSQESEEQIITLKHRLHIDLGPVHSES
ncbi:dynactin subunit 4-like isoform X2 [Montipora foliosa]|uniref:dynactin subunit 4-like isoform X2 n=1 Tax=Montipora foliosa TaxID=591990 RepID=UPI0035F1DD7A